MSCSVRDVVVYRCIFSSTWILWFANVSVVLDDMRVPVEHLHVTELLAKSHVQNKKFMQLSEPTCEIKQIVNKVHIIRGGDMCLGKPTMQFRPVCELK